MQIMEQYQQHLHLTLQYIYKRGQEYCFVVMTNSLDYKIWISQMGETDVSGSNRVISGQPHLGFFI